MSVLNSEIILCDPNELIPYNKNSKTHPDYQIERLAKNFNEFGFDQPIVVDGNNVIIKGHGRRLAALKAGLAEVPVIIRTDLTETQIKAARIADNKLAETDWDIDFLKEDLSDLLEEDFDLDFIGFSDDDLADMDFGDLDTDSEESESQYTGKVNSPIYEPSEEKPDINSLVDKDKTNALLKNILAAGISEEETDFLMAAAQRHIVFDYEKIADFYAHASAEVQKLMEESALIIVDFNKAIENGYVKLSAAMKETMDQDYG